MSEEKPSAVKVAGEYIDIKSKLSYRGKTSGYYREETIIRQIIDKNGQKVDAVWEKEWSEVAPGIETRYCPESTRIGGVRHEAHSDKQVRIYRCACPVRINFLDRAEYVHYDDDENSSSNDKAYWVQYEV